MNKQFLTTLILFLSAIGTTAFGYTAWQGETTGTWDTRANWAGGFPTNTSTVRLNHEYQTNTYSVIVRTDAITDTLSIEDYDDVPIHVRIDNTGSLQFNSMRMGAKEEDRESRFTIDGGSVWALDPINPAVTNTAFLIGDNPGCIATLSVLNNGMLSVMAPNGLIIASGKESIGRLIVSNGNIRIKDSLLLGTGPGAFGELIVSGTSSISITDALHIAKLVFGDFAPIGIVQIAGGVLECGTLNIGANGKGSLTFSDGTVRVIAGGITLGQTTSTAQLNVYGGMLETIESSMFIGHLDSTGTMFMTNGNVNIDGSIALGSSSRSTGLLDLTGGAITAKQLVIGAATSSTGTVHIHQGILCAGETVHIGPLGTGSLFLDGGTLTTTNFLLGGGASAECNLTGGELVILGTTNESIQILNSVLCLEKALIKWSNSNVTDWITNAVSTGAITWSNGLAHGTYSTNGFDGYFNSEDSILYWDNLENGSSFAQSVIWVEKSPYKTWADNYLLSGTNALWSADPDHDGLNNLSEFGLGGNPTNGYNPDILPTFQIKAGLDLAEYVYRQRSDPAAYGLTYTLELSTNLLAQSWTTNGYNLIGVSPDIDGFRTVTNQIPMTGINAQFIRLQIQYELN